MQDDVPSRRPVCLEFTISVPTYPSSTLHTYYPSSPSHVAPDNAHISSLPPPFGVLPSVSNERIPSLRQTPSVHHSLSQHLHISPRINSPYQYQQNNVQSRNSPTRHTPDPASFHPTTHSHFQNIAFQTAAAPQTHTAFPIIAPQPVTTFVDNIVMDGGERYPRNI